MANQQSNSTPMNFLIGASLILNITYMSIKFYKMYQQGKKGKCRCQNKREHQ